jgi:hypothetical protein
MYSIYWNDLTFEKQQEFIESQTANLTEDAKKEGEEFLQRDEHKGRTWQEAYCREYDIDSDIWEDENEAKNFDWEYAVRSHIEEKAEDKCVTGFKYCEVEI